MGGTTNSTVLQLEKKNNVLGRKLSKLLVPRNDELDTLYIMSRRTGSSTTSPPSSLELTLFDFNETTMELSLTPVDEFCKRQMFVTTLPLTRDASMYSLSLDDVYPHPSINPFGFQSTVLMSYNGTKPSYGRRCPVLTFLAQKNTNIFDQAEYLLASKNK